MFSQLGVGTTFRIYLPLVTLRQTGDADDAVPTLPRGDETLLLVEDDRVVRKLLKKMLTNYGYTVLEAGDGDQAIALFRANPAAVDLVISDFIMPGKNGKEVSDVLRTIRPNIKVLFISGYADDVLISRGISSHQLHYLTKPVNPEALLVKVRAVLDGHE